MRKANRSDKESVIQIITDSFYENQRINWTIKNDNKKDLRLRELIIFAFERSLRRDGVYISSDETGVAICYRFNKNKESLIDHYHKLKFGIKAVGIGRIPKVLKLGQEISSKRPKSIDYLHFWFFGVSKIGRGKGAGMELVSHIFEESKRSKLPIYAETSSKRTCDVYKRFGFEVYDIFDHKESSIRVWLMRREPKV